MILAANWKMYLNENDSKEFIQKMNLESDIFEGKNIMIFPSHSSIRTVKNLSLIHI